MNSSILETIVAGTDISVNVVIRACTTEEGGGFAAECLEIPGCFSEGETEEEAFNNIKDAVNSCLAVIFEDSLNRLRTKMDLGSIDLRGVAKQQRLRIETPHLASSSYA